MAEKTILTNCSPHNLAVYNSTFMGMREREKEREGEGEMA